MLINNTEALKSWLVVVLEPLCDADSSALARYVLALLKKDKPEKELKRVMIEQLDVFLGEETKSFVDRLFEAINSDEYLKGPIILPPKMNLELSEDNTTTNNSNEVKCQVQVVAKTALTSTGTEGFMRAEANDFINTMKLVDSEAIINIDDNRTNAEDNKTKDIRNADISTTIKEYITTSANHQMPNSSNQRFLSHQTFANKSEGPTSLPCGSVVNVRGAGTFDRQHNQSHRIESSLPIDRSNNADKENVPREGCRGRNSLQSKSRSRSRTRSNERSTRRSRSRDRRINDREKSQRQFRNKSPPPLSSSGDPRHDRRRAGGSGNANTSGMYRRRIGANSEGNETKSPRFSKNGAVSGRTSNRFPNSSRSRSTSLERNNRKQSPNSGRYVNRTEGNNSPGELRHPHHEKEKRQRCRDFDEKGYCVRGETCPWDHGINPVVFEGINNSALISMSLREYNPDAPDLWSRSGPPTSMAAPPAQASIMGSTNNVPNINPFAATSRQSGLLIGRPIAFPPIPGGDKLHAGPAALANFTGNSTSVAGFQIANPLMSFPFNPAVSAPLQRELIPIPVVDARGVSSVGVDINASMPLQSKRRYEAEEPQLTAAIDGPTKRKVPAHSRLGPRVPSSMQNCSLELRKIPRGLNTITHLNNHFAKFGKIVNIQISYDGDPEAAIVTFSVHAEANVAYRSTEAVLNNRFIKVFWHTPENPTATDVSPAVVAQTGNRKNSQYHLNNIQTAQATPTNTDSTKTTNTQGGTQSASSTNNPPNNSNSSTAVNNTTSSATSTDEVNKTVNTTAAGSASMISTNTTSLRLKNNVMPRSVASNNVVMRKKQEEQVKAVNQLANGLRKRKQELLQNYVKQMKSTLELVERCEPSDPQRAETLATIKVLQETIDKLRKEIALEQEQMQVQIQNQQPQTQIIKKSKEQQKKELLDIELELFAQQQEGNDTTAIQKRLDDLQRSLGIIQGNSLATASNKTTHYSAGLAGGRNNIRTRLQYVEGSNKVDRRPKTIVVSAFSKGENDMVLAHLKHFGTVTNHSFDLEKNTLMVTYATRNSAEQAITRGKVFKTKRLQIVWAPVNSTDQALVPNNAAKLTGTNTSTNISTNTLLPMSAAAAALALASPTLSISSSPNQSQSNSETDMIATDTLPELRLEDEEEDEESEDRSWRR